MTATGDQNDPGGPLDSGERRSQLEDPSGLTRRFGRAARKAYRTTARRQPARERVEEQTRLLLGVSALYAQRAARHTFADLWDAEVSVFSQWGEDGILDLLCECSSLSKPRAIEFGAGNFTECNTRFLAEYRSASVVAVDGRTDLTATVDCLGVKWRTTVLTRQEWITPTSAPALLRDARAALGGLDIVSLDIDGNDYWVARSLPLTGEAIIVVEYNPLFGAARSVSVPRDDSFDRTQAHFSWLYYGASLRAFIDLFAAKGYTFAGTNRAGSNAFFIRDELARRLPFQAPGQGGDLSPYVDWRAREARDANGNLSYEHGEARIAIMADLPLIDTRTGDLVCVRDADQVN